MSVRVIVTAGGQVPAELQQPGGSEVKALLRLGPRTLLQQAVAAAHESRHCGPIIVVGNDEVLAETPPEAEHTPVGKDAVDNLWRGFEEHGGELEAEYLALSPDLPFVTAAALDEFIERARGNCELGLPLITREDFQSAYPGAPNRFLRLDGREVTMGSAIYISGRMLKTNVPLFRDLFRCRKQPHRLAVLFGLPIALALLTGRLGLGQLEARARRLMGGTVSAVPVGDATLAYDVDTRENYDYALSRM